MFLEGEFFAQSCVNEFAFNFGVMMAAVWHLTGMAVVGVVAIKTKRCKTDTPSFAAGAT